MAFQFDVKGFWPFYLENNLALVVRFDYEAIDGSMDPIRSEFWWDCGTQSLIYDDFSIDADTGEVEWKDCWFLAYRPGFGIAEWRDDYPQEGWTSYIWGRRRKLVFSTPIGWGNLGTIGGYYVNQPKVDIWDSSPPQFGSCRQAINFERIEESFTTIHGDTLNDVLVFAYLQQWGEKCVGGRYWMAKDVGPVAVQWLGVMPEETKYLGVDHSKINLITTARMDAKISWHLTHTSLGSYSVPSALRKLKQW